MIDWRILRVAVIEGGQLQLKFIAEFGFVIQVKICVQVIPVSIFKLNLDSSIFCDHAVRHECDLRRVIVDHIVPVLSPL